MAYWLGCMLSTGLGYTVTVMEAELEHPCASVPVTEYIVVTCGLTCIPDCMSPLLQTYCVEGSLLKALSVAVLPSHICWFMAFRLRTGFGFTVMATEAAPEHPFPSVPVTEYTVLDEGATIMTIPDWLLLHTKLLMYTFPLAISVAVVPAQTDEEEA